MASSNSAANGRDPNRSMQVTPAARRTRDGHRQPAVRRHHRRAPRPARRRARRSADLGRRRAAASVSARGDRPDALRPCSRSPSQTIANRSEPMSFEPGWTTVSAIAVAIAASTALPPRPQTASPAEAASGWLVATTPRAAKTGWRARRESVTAHCRPVPEPEGTLTNPRPYLRANTGYVSDS